MQRTLVRAMLLAISLLMLLALPAAAQIDDEGWLLVSEDENVLIGINENVAVGPADRAEGVVVVSGQGVIEGNVERLFAVDADVTVSGSTARIDEIIALSGTLDIADGATVGNLYYAGTTVDIDETVIVEGENVDASEEFAGAFVGIAALFIGLILLLLVGVAIASLALTLLVIAFGTAQTRRAAATISNDVLKTIVVGVLALFVPYAIFVGLGITIVGLPLAIILWLLWSVVVFLGQVVVATWIGERILPRARTTNRPYGAAFLGMIILILLSWTGIVPLLAGIFGTGAVTLAGWRMLRGGGVPPVPPGYGEGWGQPMYVAPPAYAPPPYAPPPPPPGGPWPPQGGQPPSSWPQG